MKSALVKLVAPLHTATAIVIERAKARNEILPDVESDLIFDLMSGIMLYALIFQPTADWISYTRRALDISFKNTRYLA